MSTETDEFERPKRRKCKLTDLTVTEISLVDRPANPGARALFFKREAGEMTEEQEMTASGHTAETIEKRRAGAHDAKLTKAELSQKAHDIYEGLARERAKEKGITFEKAYDEVVRERPGVYAAMVSGSTKLDQVMGSIAT